MASELELSASAAGAGPADPAAGRRAEPPRPGSRSEGAVVSVGQYLSRQRRMRGISLDELARSTRIPLRSLERLEAGLFDGEADGFVRGFVRTVASALGLDPEDTVARLLSEVRVDAGSERTAGPLGRAALGLAAVVLLAVAVSLVRLAAQLGGGLSAAEPRIVYREDPVRALSDATLAQSSSAADGPLVPGVATGAPGPAAGPTSISRPAR